MKDLGNCAGMAELADAADSKSAEGNLVGVRPPLPAPIESIAYEINASSDAFFYAQTVPKLDLLVLALTETQLQLPTGCAGIQ